MDASGLTALNAVTSSSLHLVPFTSRAPPSFRHHNFFSPCSNSLRTSSPRISPLRSFSERCRADASPNGLGAPSSEVSSYTEFLQAVLISPQIPGNVGSIARTCAALAVKLHLIEPLGFQIDDAKLKRAGQDYWPYVVVKVHSSWSEFLEYFKKQNGEKRLLAFTMRGANIHSEFSYRKGDWLVFGSETSG